MCDFVCFFMLSYLFTCHFVSFSLPSTFHKVSINFFNTGYLIAKAHVNNLEGARRNSRVTWGNCKKAFTV